MSDGRSGFGLVLGLGSALKLVLERRARNLARTKTDICCDTSSISRGVYFFRRSHNKRADASEVDLQWRLSRQAFPTAQILPQQTQPQIILHRDIDSKVEHQREVCLVGTAVRMAGVSWDVSADNSSISPSSQKLQHVICTSPLELRCSQAPSRRSKHSLLGVCG